MNSKKVMYGTFGLLGFLLLAGGCKTQVMKDRSYVPVAEPTAGYTQVATPEYVPESSWEVETPVVSPTPEVTRAPKYPSFQIPAESEKPVVGGGEYIVKKGDMISSIAKQYKISTSALLAANGLTLESARRIRIGQKLVIPGSDFVATTPKSSPEAKSAKIVDGKYVVVANDNVAKIAKKLNVKAEALMSVNKLDNESAKRLQIGQKLIIPGKDVTVVSKTKVNTPAVSGNFYVVKSGDNIPKIARSLNVKASDLMAANNLDEAATRRLQIGQKLVIPGRGVTVAPKPAVVAPVAPVEVAPVVAPVEVAPPVAVVDSATEDVLSAIETSMESNSGVAVSTENVATGVSQSIQLTEAVTPADFAKKYGITVETLETFNGEFNLVDGKIPANEIVFIPSK